MLYKALGFDARHSVCSMRQDYKHLPVGMEAPAVNRVQFLKAASEPLESATLS